MAYTTVAQIRAETGFSNDTKVPDSRIESYITEADKTIDGFVSRVYILPFATNPELLETLSRQLAIILLYVNEYGEESQGTDKGWEKRLKWIMEDLKLIQSKELLLVDASGEVYPLSSVDTISAQPNNTTSAEGYPDEKRLSMNDEY